MTTYTKRTSARRKKKNSSIMDKEVIARRTQTLRLNRRRGQLARKKKLLRDTIYLLGRW